MIQWDTIAVFAVIEVLVLVVGIVVVPARSARLIKKSLASGQYDAEFSEMLLRVGVKTWVKLSGNKKSK